MEAGVKFVNQTVVSRANLQQGIKIQAENWCSLEHTWKSGG